MAPPPKELLPPPQHAPAYWAEACKHLVKKDRVLRRVIPQYPNEALALRGDAFATLARAVVSQQVAPKSAAAQWKKFQALLPDGTTPAHVLALGVDAMRACGLSARKISYLQDLAEHFTQGKLQQERWLEMDDESIITELTAIRGIGRWTAEMFLVHFLHRPNVLPLDDAALLKGISENYFSGEAVSRSDAREVAEAWKPWCTVAAWYIWRSLDPQPSA